MNEAAAAGLSTIIRMQKYLVMTKITSQGIPKEVSLYHWPPVDWFGLVCCANKNKNCQLLYSWFPTSQTGGQRYSDSSPFSIPWTSFRRWAHLVLWNWCSKFVYLFSGAMYETWTFKIHAVSLAVNILKYRQCFHML